MRLVSSAAGRSLLVCLARPNVRLPSEDLTIETEGLRAIADPSRPRSTWLRWKRRRHQPCGGFVHDAHSVADNRADKAARMATSAPIAAIIARPDAGSTSSTAEAISVNRMPATKHRAPRQIHEAICERQAKSMTWAPAKRRAKSVVSTRTSIANPNAIAPNTLIEAALHQSTRANASTANTHPASVAPSDRHKRPAIQNSPVAIASATMSHVCMTDTGTTAIHMMARAEM